MVNRMDVPEFARAPRKLSIVLTALTTARQSNGMQRVAQWLPKLQLAML
jgi:hypothetical protein